MPYWNRNILVDNSKSIDILGIEYRDINLTIIEGAQSMIECGLVVSKEKKKKKGKEDLNEVSSEVTNQNETVLMVTDGKEEESKRSE